jgi:signal transduction histidine kinase
MVPNLLIRTSVGFRLTALLLIHAMTTLFLMTTGIYSLDRTAADEQHFYRFQLQAIVAISRAVRTANDTQNLIQKYELKNRSELDRLLERDIALLEEFEQNYENKWRTSEAQTSDAALFKSDLHNAGKSDLLKKEESSFLRFSSSLSLLKSTFTRTDRLEAIKAILGNLLGLRDINDLYAAISNDRIQVRAMLNRRMLLAVGLGSLLLSTLLGILIHRSISPRIHTLVRKVKRFQELGLNEKVQIVDTGRDEIALLSHALDSGFQAIEYRERERIEFLAIIAHELKTPVTSILGYSSMLLKRCYSPELYTSALTVIKNQAWRMSRLIEGFLFSARARSRQLEFHPTQINLVTIAQEAKNDITKYMPGQKFEFTGAHQLPLLGDPVLLLEAMRSLLGFATAHSDPDSTVTLEFQSLGANIRLSVHIQGSEFDQKRIEEIFSYMPRAEYEESTILNRTVTGLYLCREVGRIHHGRFWIENNLGVGPIFILEIPA